MSSQILNTNIIRLQQNILFLDTAFRNKNLTQIAHGLIFYDIFLKSIFNPENIRNPQLQKESPIREWTTIYSEFIASLDPNISYSFWRDTFFNFTRIVCQKITEYFLTESPFHGFSKEELKAKRALYRALSNPQNSALDQEWQEAIDFSFQCFGKMVFDQGLHGFETEPGFIDSWHAAKSFLSENLDIKFSSSLYLQLHRIACRHFDSEKTHTLMGIEKVGVFRTSDDEVCWNTTQTSISPKVSQELQELNEALKIKFGVELAHFEFDNNLKSYVLRYVVMSRQQMTQIFDYFVDNFHKEIALAKTNREKLKAICSLIRNMEWSHSVKDGCGRCDTLILNFLLVQYGFNPVIIIPDPYICNIVGLDRWISYVEEGIFSWISLESCLRTLAHSSLPT